ncbi:MAG: thermonuclease family protein [Desulfovermiculus sp.]|nr:thermonuclease family protein [Desulfovermiculus sp.]
MPALRPKTARLACILSLCAFFLVVTASPIRAYTAFVLWVTDGDSLTVVDADFDLLRIRVYGIDCPESDQPYGFSARVRTAWEVWARPVEVLPIEKDRYGRLVARVQKNGKDLSAVLTASGLAWVYDRYCKQSVCREWEELEQKARHNQLGLWADADPIPPWKWRHGHRPDRGWRWW